MAENVAVKHEVANVRPAEIQAQRDAWERVTGSLPKWDLDHIQILPHVGWRQLRYVEVLLFDEEV